MPIGLIGVTRPSFQIQANTAQPMIVPPIPIASVDDVRRVELVRGLVVPVDQHRSLVDVAVACEDEVHTVLLEHVSGMDADFSGITDDRVDFVDE